MNGLFSLLGRSSNDFLTWFGYAGAGTVGLGLEDVAADPVPEVAGQRVAAVVEELHAKVAAGKHEPLLLTTKPVLSFNLCNWRSFTQPLPENRRAARAGRRTRRRGRNSRSRRCA